MKPDSTVPLATAPRVSRGTIATAETLRLHALDTAAEYGESAAFQARATFDLHERRTESAYQWARAAASQAFRARPDLKEGR